VARASAAARDFVLEERRRDKRRRLTSLVRKIADIFEREYGRTHKETKAARVSLDSTSNHDFASHPNSNRDNDNNDDSDTTNSSDERFLSGRSAKKPRKSDK
jgi:hypothetical protein